MKKQSLKPIASALGVTLAATLTSISIAQAEQSPFGMSELSSGYMVAGAKEGKCGGSKNTEGKCGEGKCGGSKNTEGKCGGSKNSEGKCGEGKCGGSKNSEGKSGEGKCGGSKSSEGKCGEGKCGGK